MGGGGWRFAWGPQDDQQSIAAIHKALDAGINWIDTAAVYGLGHSEEIVAEALNGMSNKPYVFTKCERRWDTNREIYKSLKATRFVKNAKPACAGCGSDAIDLYQIHWPEPDEDIEEGLGHARQAQGRGQGPLDRSFQLQCRAAESDRTNCADHLVAAAVLRFFRLKSKSRFCLTAPRHNIGVIVYSPMKSGMLTGKMTRERIANMPDDDFRKRTPQFQEPLLTRNLQLVESLREIGNAHGGKTPGEVAIAWTLGNPAVTAAIVGLRSPEQVDGVIGAADLRLSEDEVKRIADFMAVPV